MHFIFLFCRAGFENECSAEIQEIAAELNIFGYCKAKPQASYVTFHPQDSSSCDYLMSHVNLEQLIFARQWFKAFDILTNLAAEDRIKPLLETYKLSPAPVNSVIYEHLDTNEGKALSALCKSFAKPFEKKLASTGYLQAKAKQQMHLCFLSSSAVVIGTSPNDNASPWPMGIPRLRLAKSAPSRSSLKLDEAILTFFSREEAETKLHSGMQAVDLGAAPGGWTWQLAKRNMFVTAIDNGPMQKDLLESGLVRHKKVDAFRYQPEKTVDWMVCDIVDKPARVTQLVIDWLSQGWCKNTIFNLKLPMKKRYMEVRTLLNRIHNSLSEQGIAYQFKCKQLYHDREEVTVFIEILS